MVRKPLRDFLSRMPFAVIMLYSRSMATLSLIPGLGSFLEKAGVCMRGDIPRIPGETTLDRMKRSFKITSLNTFDWFGSHEYQHYKSEDEIRSLVTTLQPDSSKVRNLDKYFARPAYIGCALRIFR